MVRLAIAGSGGMAHYQAKKFSSLPSCVLSACKDHVMTKAEAFAHTFEIPLWYDTLASLIEQKAADALSIAVVDWRHADLCKQAIDGGLAVFCEKPMTRTLEEAQDLAQLAYLSERPTFVNFSKRNSAALHALKAIVANGDLGATESISVSYLQGWVATGIWGDWRTDPRWRWRLLPYMGTAGVVGDLGSHVADALLFVFGDISVERITHAVDMAAAYQNGSLGDLVPTQEFLAEPPTWLEIEALCRVKSGITQGPPCKVHISTIEREALDDFSIVVTGEKAKAVLDLRRSRTAIELVYRDSGERLEIQGPPVISTYEQFCLLADSEDRSGLTVLPKPIPDFHHGLRVQRILNQLAPGGLPL